MGVKGPSLSHLAKENKQVCKTTHQFFHKTVHYKMVLYIRWFKGGPQKCCTLTKIYNFIDIDLYEGHSFNVVIGFYRGLFINPIYISFTSTL